MTTTGEIGHKEANRSSDMKMETTLSKWSRNKHSNSIMNSNSAEEKILEVKEPLFPDKMFDHEYNIGMAKIKYKSLLKEQKEKKSKLKEELENRFTQASLNHQNVNSIRMEHIKKENKKIRWRIKKAQLHKKNILGIG